MRRIICVWIASAALLCAFCLTHAEPAMPDSIVRVGACATPGIAWGVFVQGNYAHVADRDRLTVVDVSLPSLPAPVGDTGTIGIALGICVVETLAYINDWGYFSILNVSNPLSPITVGWCLTGLVSNEGKGIQVVDTLAFVAAADSGLEIINISNPVTPFPIGHYPTSDNSIDLFVLDTLTYIAAGDSLLIVNVADPTTPLAVGGIAMPEPCYGVSVKDTFAFVVCLSPLGFEDGTLQVVNVTDPSNPTIIAECHTPGDPWSIVVSGDYAYVATADWFSSSEAGKKRDWVRLHPSLTADVEGGLRLVSISDPTTPILVASYDTPGDPRGVFTVSDLVFVADYDSLQILRHINVGIQEDETVGSPEFGVLSLMQNYPNPFTAYTAIEYHVPCGSDVTLTVYDIAGKRVRSIVDSRHGPGCYTVYWDGKDNHGMQVVSGVYFCQLSTSSERIARKMIFVQ